MDFSFEKLKEKKGPLPLWAWIVLFAGLGYLAYTFLGRKAEPLPGNAQGAGGDGEFQSSQTMTKTDPETGDQYTTSYSAQGKSFLPGQFYWNQGMIQPQPGDVYVNLPGNGDQAPAAGGANYTGRTEGFWFTLYRDMYPQEVAQQAYDLPGYNGGPDFVSLAYDAVAIMLANPQVKVPGTNLIPKGTKLFIPGFPAPAEAGKPHKWNKLTDQDNKRENPQIVPVPQSTREVRVA